MSRCRLRPPHLERGQWRPLQSASRECRTYAGTAKDFSDKTRISLRELEEIELIDSYFQNVNIDYFK